MQLHDRSSPEKHSGLSEVATQDTSQDTSVPQVAPSLSHPGRERSDHQLRALAVRSIRPLSLSPRRWLRKPFRGRRQRTDQHTVGTIRARLSDKQQTPKAALVFVCSGFLRQVQISRAVASAVQLSKLLPRWIRARTCRL